MELKMSDFKSKLPDLKELTGMIGKLCTDVKNSVVEIAGAYKEKHKDTGEKPAEAPKATEAPAPKAEEPKAETSEPVAPKVEEPKVETPEPVAPEVEEPKSEEPPKEEG